MALLQSGKSKNRPGGANKHITMYTHAGRFLARKKGRTRSRPRNILRKFRENWFKCVRYMIRWYDPRIQKTVRDACEGTQILWDDFLTMSIAGNCYGTIEIDGRIYYPLAVKIRVAESLDAIGDDAGIMLGRGADLWEAIPAGTAGQVLTSNGPDTLPSWQ